VGREPKVRRAFEVMEVGSADNALERAEANAYDLVLCDVTLGETSGVDGARGQRRSSGLQRE